MQEALVDAMKFDLEEGNFCDVLLDKITDEDDKKRIIIILLLLLLTNR
jgi:hypothetical protein